MKCIISKFRDKRVTTTPDLATHSHQVNRPVGAQQGLEVGPEHLSPAIVRVSVLVGVLHRDRVSHQETVICLQINRQAAASPVAQDSSRRVVVTRPQERDRVGRHSPLGHRLAIKVITSDI